MTKVIYVTGCLGFIGYHITKQCLEKGWRVRGIDTCTYAAHLPFLDDLNKHKNFVFEKKDINDLDKLYDCDYVINTAAETHVDNSIVSSDVFLNSNIKGVHHLLEMIKDKTPYRRPTLLHFSTDEVYGDIETGFHKETDLLVPSNPYSATKAAADMLILAWARTYQVPFVIVRPTNNYGEGQYIEKLIPRSCKNLVLGRPILLHDMGEPRRTWLHVSDTANAIITIIEKGVKNEIYNISGNFEEKNIVVAKKIVDTFFKLRVKDYNKYLDFSEKRPGQDVRYAIDDSKLKSLGWRPQASFDRELHNIVKWYKKNFIW